MKRIIMLNDDCRLANVDEHDSLNPYVEANYNQSYQYFLEQGKKKGLDIVIAHYLDYNSGKIDDGWAIEDGNWIKTGELSVEFVYDKFPANIDDTKAVKKDIQDRGIGILNHPDLEASLKDKQKNYEAFSDVIPLTRSVKGSYSEMVATIESIRDTQLHPDLDSSKIIMKPRTGHGGNGIIVVEGTDYERLKDIEYEDYILQPFLETNNGISELGIDGRHDLRIIALNGEPKVAYVRQPIRDSLIINASYNGKIRYFEIEEIPDNFMELVSSIDLELTRFDPRIYSCDMAVGISGKVWVYEMNGKPGQVWNSENPVVVEKIKELQEVILDALVQGIYNK